MSIIEGGSAGGRQPGRMVRAPDLKSRGHGFSLAQTI